MQLLKQKMFFDRHVMALREKELINYKTKQSQKMTDKRGKMLILQKKYETGVSGWHGSGRLVDGWCCVLKAAEKQHKVIMLGPIYVQKHTLIKPL